MSKYTNLLRNRVARHLALRNWSQNKLAQEMKVASSDLSDWLTGKVAVRYERICAIAEALEIQPWELLKPDSAQPTPMRISVQDSRSLIFGRLISALSSLDETKLMAAATHLHALGLIDGAFDSSETEKLSNREG